MDSYHVTVEEVFPASHQLYTYDGELEPLHNHQWRVQLAFAGPELDSMGVLIDFVQVQRILSDILAGFRNRHLNDLPCFEQINPSAENLARCIFESLQGELDAPDLLHRVTVWEAQNCSAGYGRETLM